MRDREKKNHMNGRPPPYDDDYDDDDEADEDYLCKKVKKRIKQHDDLVLQHLLSLCSFF